MTTNRDGLIELKQKWVPLFLAGVTFFVSGAALMFLWLYRNSRYPSLLVSWLTTNDPDGLPAGTLLTISAALFAAIGGWVLVYAIRKINESEVGSIDSFWWKIAVAGLAGQWWIGQPRVVVLGSGAGLPTLLRALKTFCSQITVVGSPTPELILALADDAAGVAYVLQHTSQTDLMQLSYGLRLHGNFLQLESPLAFDTLTRASVIILCPDLERATDWGLTLPTYLRQARGKKVLVGAVTASTPQALAQAAEWCTAQCGELYLLANNNYTVPLPPPQHYQHLPNAAVRDLVDWSAPEKWEEAKLAVFLREAVYR